jgi:hypothetical protein
MTETKTHSRLGFLIGFFLGILAVVAIVAEGPVDLDAWFERTWPWPMWTSAFPIVGIGLALAWVSARLRSAIGWAITAAWVPTGIGTMGVRLVEPDPSWALVLRGLGLALILSAALVGVVLYAREFLELERLLFTKATSVAFFVTILGTAAYA